MVSLHLVVVRDPIFRLLNHPRFSLIVIGLSLALTSPALFNGFQFDDYLLRSTFRNTADPIKAINTLFILMDGQPDHTLAKMETGAFPWYILPEGQVAFWRPLSAMTHWIDYVLWPNAPPLMHLQSLLWYAILVYVVTIFYRQFISAYWSASTGGKALIWANLATLLYSLDDARGFAVGWLANRNAILATLFGVLACLAHDRWRRQGWRWGIFAAPILLGLSLLAVESGLATFAYLVAYVFCLDSAPRFRRLLTLAPYGIVGIIWRVAYVALGYGAWGTSYIDPARDPMRFVQAAIERIPILLLGHWAFPAAEVYSILQPPASILVWCLALILIFVGVLLFWPLIRRSKLARFFALGSVLATIPPAASLPANRLLGFVGLGAFGLLVCFADYVFAASRFQRLIGQALVAIHLLQIPLLPLTTFAPYLLSNIESAIATVPSDSAIVRQSVIFVNAPSYFHISFIPDIRAVTGQPIPARIRGLAPGLVPSTLTRLDNDTLVIQPAGGYFTGYDAVFRDPSSHPFRVGQIVELSDVQIEILAITTDGRPDRVAFHFKVPLESDTFRWLEWVSGHYVPFSLPSVGQTLTLPAIYPGLP